MKWPLLAFVLLASVSDAMLVVQSGSRHVTTAAAGGLTDGGTATISGSGFGTNTSAVQLFTGGLTSAQETTADDTIYDSVAPAAFRAAPISTTSCAGVGNVWRIDTGRSYGVRTRSLYWDAIDGRNGCVSNVGQAVHVWSPGLSSLGSAYIAWKQYMAFPTNVTEVQFKTLRLISQYTAEGMAGVEDAADNNLLMSNWHDGGTGGDYNWQGYFAIQPAASLMLFPPFSSNTSYFGDSGWSDTGSNATSDDNAWYEIEVEFSDSSTTGSADALISHRLRRLSDGAIVASHARNNVQIYPGSGSRYKYVMWQTGLFNGAGTGINEGGNGKVWYQDIYASAASRARVRLSNHQTFASATVTEICPWTAWSDTEIQCTVDQGGISSLATPLYWHIWNSAGTLVNPTTGILAN